MENITLRENECFISDLGRSSTAKTDDGTLTVGRYAAIKNHMGRMEVLEVSNDLQYLMKKFNVAADKLGVVTV